MDPIVDPVVADAAPALPDIHAIVNQIAADSVAAAVANITQPDKVVPAVIAAVEKDIKPFYQSKTLIALAVAAIAFTLKVSGHAVAPEYQSALVDAVETIVTFVGMFGGALFRIVGKKTLA